MLDRQARYVWPPTKKGQNAREKMYTEGIVDSAEMYKRCLNQKYLNRKRSKTANEMNSIRLRSDDSSSVCLLGVFVRCLVAHLLLFVVVVESLLFSYHHRRSPTGGAEQSEHLPFRLSVR